MKTPTKLHFTLSASLDDILYDLREEIYHANCSICIKTLQHWDVSLAGWVVFFDPRGDAKLLTEHLVPTVKTIVKFEPIFAFTSRRIFNGSTDNFAAKKHQKKE